MHSKSAKPCTRVRDLAHRTSLFHDKIGRNDAGSLKPERRETGKSARKTKRREDNQKLETTIASAFWEGDRRHSVAPSCWRNVEREEDLTLIFFALSLYRTVLNAAMDGMIYMNCVYSQWINSYVSYSCQNTVAILGVSEYGSMRFSLS